MGDEWLVDEQIDVDIQQLKDFALAIQREMETNFQPSFDNGLRPMLTVQAPFGGGGMKEAAFFRGRHDESRMAISHLMGDVMKGLTALSMAAMSISAEYLTGDALAQATNEDVYNAFTAVDGQDTLSGRWQEGTENPADSVPESALNPAPMNPYHGLDSCPTGEQREETPAWAQSEVVGEGAGAYVIHGDGERMHGEDLRLDQSDLR
ncbi:hypothetical protein ACN26Z_00975 [Verrucosispora sp. WMMD703]|uniref:Uncharacterized protein n=1 Tax=Micromonospora sediminimaris TaxID=547162 RepID=A0A9W5XLS8_9ACTN|nr:MULTISPECIES: hypothetical protein [Micromonospora]WFE45939.1 hypothetical protein O7624_17090 [Verrucosispora sp. WMMD1129]GIJ35690.1 hypothetical protein Vse01_48380 [Micromonospora sediminimaris]SFD75733.1 hypothetical protein SAMN05216284_12414 [Micromonospora sediminimaris]